MTREVIKRIVKGITDKIECNTVDIDDWAEFWGFTRDEYEEFLDMPLKALEQESMWIPVSERLPEEHTSVIGTTEFNDVYEAELYNDCGKNKWYADGNYDVPIVAWMPLPEPYSAESEE